MRAEGASCPTAKGLQMLDVVRHPLAAVLVVADETDLAVCLLPKPNRGVVADTDVPCRVDRNARQEAVLTDPPLQLSCRKLISEVGAFD